MSRLRLALASASIELRLHARNPGFWVLVGGWLTALAFFAHRCASGQAEGPEAMGYALMPMLATVFAVYATQVTIRDRREGTAETIDALPAAHSPRIWGRVLGLAIVIGLLTLAFLAAEVWSLGPGAVRASSLLYWALAYFANLGLAATIGFLAGSLFRNPLLAFPVAAGGWIGWIMFFLWLRDGTGFAQSWVLSPFDPSRRWHDTNLLWGAFPTWGLALPHYVLNIVLAAGMAALTVLIAKRARDRDHLRWGTACVLAACILAGGTSLRDFLAADRLMVAGHVRQVDLLRETPGTAERSLGPGGAQTYQPDFSVALYSGHLELGPARRMSMTLDMELDVPARLLDAAVGGSGTAPLEFTLNGLFAVGSCRAGYTPDALQECAFSRHGHLLEVHFPATSGGSGGPQSGTGATRRVVIHLEYEGDVWVWNADLGYSLELVAAVDPVGTMLPAGFAWYPLPGRHPLGSVIGISRDPHWWTVYHHDTPLPDSQWRLSVTRLWGNMNEGRPTQDLISAIVSPAQGNDAGPGGTAARPADLVFAGPAYGGCFVIGAPSVSTVEVGDVKFFCPPGLVRQARPLADYLNRALEFLATAGVELGRPFVVATVSDRGTSGVSSPPRLGGGLAVRERRIYSDVQAVAEVDSVALIGRDTFFSKFLDRAVFGCDPTDGWRWTVTVSDETQEALFGPYYVGEAFRGFLAGLTLGHLHAEEQYQEVLAHAAPRIHMAGGPALFDAFENTLALLDGFRTRHGDEAAVQLCRALYPDVRAMALDPEGFAARVAAHERGLAGGGDR